MKKMRTALAAMGIIATLGMWGCSSTNETETTERLTFNDDQHGQLSTMEGELLPEETEEITTEEITTEEAEPSSEELLEMEAESILSEMTISEKVGQLFMVNPESLMSETTTAELNNYTGNGRTAINDIMIDSLDRFNVGGVIFFSANIDDPDQITEFISDLQDHSKYGLFVGVDEEGGDVARLGNNWAFDVETFSSMEHIGDTGDTENAVYVGKTIGQYLTRYGFNVDFAPDADINTNPSNRVIGNRAFGSDADLVSDMVAACVQGFHEYNIATCVKHYPGHGDTYGDTHQGYVSVDKTWEELKECEIKPFQAAIENGTDMIMVAHISLPNATSEDVPASLSRELITDKLRGELSYDGIVITDALAMGAISDEYTSEECAILAVKAGVDVLLMPRDFEAAYGGVLEAVESGEISSERIDESVLRIIKLKLKLGLMGD